MASEIRDIRLVRPRLVPPPCPQGAIPRPRVTELVGSLLARSQVIAVIATAGSGKSTALAQTLAEVELAVAWLTCDASDVASGRLVTYLEAAVRSALDDVGAVATASIEAGLPHAEAVGVLMTAVGAASVLVVLDEIDRLGDDPAAWGVIDAMVRYAGPGVRIVLAGRTEPPPHLLHLRPGQLRMVGDSHLAFTPEEAAAALGAEAGSAAVDRILHDTGGWVTGVLFEAWRADEHVAGTGGEVDPLSGYLSSHILSQLPDDLRDFLVRTSVLDEITGKRAGGLGVARPEAALNALRRCRLPASWDRTGRTLRHSPRFREYLLQVLERSKDHAVVRRAHGRLLFAEGHDEEAVEELLGVDAVDEAVAPASRSILGVVGRGDFAVADRWLAALDGTSAAATGAFAEARLMLAVGRADLGEAARIADDLAARGELDRTVRASDQAMALICWAYLHAARMDDVDDVLEAAWPGPAERAIRAAARVVRDGGAGAPVELCPPSGGLADAFALVAQYSLGRVGDLASVSAGGWVDMVASPWILAALRATGQTRRALKLYDEAMENAPSPVLEIFVGPELLMDAGLIERARASIDTGRVAADRSGSLGLRGLNRLSAVRYALRVDRDPEAALTILDGMVRDGTSAFAFLDEATRAWRGLALLIAGRDGEAAAELRAAVASMQAGNRILELPGAGVWLAEAEWRAGEEAAADTAADIALAAAGQQRSDHLLLQALGDFPVVVSRRLDAEADHGSAWFGVAGRLRAADVPVATGTGIAVHLQEFGERRLLVGREARSAGIAKAYELLALLAAQRRRSISREELLELLFDGQAGASARTYLRQVLHRLRQALPDGALQLDEGVVRLDDGIDLTTDSVIIEARLLEAGRLHGRERLDAIGAVLESYGRGAYLPGVRGRWADDRERHLDQMVTDARDDAASLALSLGSLDEADLLARLALDGDPFRETAWRTRMQVAHARGDEAGVVDVYQRCRTRFAEIGAAPSTSTERLLDTLRR